MIPVKMRQMPGDVPKQTKIAMMEDRLKPDSRGTEKLAKKRSKAFRRMIKMRERATLRERERQAIREAMEE